MTQEIADLTDKEKEALRLLVEGHDAKSSAVSLGISVHTINDRLRNARRKLHVSSSREAARILRDAEGEEPQDTPQNLTHASLGIAEDGARADAEVLNQHSHKEPMRFTWLAGGILIMSLLIAVAVVAAVSTSSDKEAAPGASSGATPAATVDTASASQSSEASPAATARARRFISAVDAGDWNRSWDVAGAFFQSQAGADDWAALVEPVRSPLGTVEERRLANVQKVQSLPGAPDGDYEILQYQTKYSNESAIATETVILVRNGDGFDIAGYFIR